MLLKKFIERWKQTALGTFLNGRLFLSVNKKKEKPRSSYVLKMLLGLNMLKLLDICLMILKVNKDQASHVMYVCTKVKTQKEQKQRMIYLKLRLIVILKEKLLSTVATVLNGRWTQAITTVVYALDILILEDYWLFLW